MSVLPFAAAPYILRAAHKDQYLCEKLLSEPLTEAVSAVFGARFANAHDSKLAMLALFLYYFCGGAVARQTPGEEFCDVLQVSASWGGNTVLGAGRLRKTMLAALLAIQGPALQAVARRLYPTEMASDVVGVVKKLSSALFYLTDVYVSVPHRLTGTQYVSLQARNPQAHSSRPGAYITYGVLHLIELLVRWYVHRKRVTRRAGANPDTAAAGEYGGDDEGQRSVSEDDNDDGNGATGHCTLCLGTRKDPTATTCGHIYCWRCIAGFIRSSPAQALCPLCRQRIELKGLVPLSRYLANP